MDRPGSHNPKGPYARKDGRKSIFSKVTDSMRGMLSPSWLSDLVSNTKTEPPKSTQEMKPAATPEAGIPSPSRMPPPPGQEMSPLAYPPLFQNQMLPNGQPRTLDFSRPGQSSEAPPAMAMFQQGNFPPPMSEFTSAQLPLTRITEKSDSVIAIAEDTMSQRSDSSKSTSGCSSMVPQIDLTPGGEKRKAPVDDVDSSQGTSHQPSPLAKRQKLEVSISGNRTFSRRLSDSYTQRPSAVQRPAFNTTLFASPLQNESSLLGSNIHESSFYPGKTVYGGRSSLSFSSRKKVDLNKSLPARLSMPVKAFMKAKPRVNPNKEAVTSSTAKRILEALDRMSTPMNDAKKIPVIMSKKAVENPSFFARDSSRMSVRSGPPTSNLSISTPASISKNRQVSFAQPQPPSEKPTVEPAAPVSTLARRDTVVIDDGNYGSSGKMRRDKSYHRGSASAKPIDISDEDTVIIPNLQTDFTLPVANMPKFSFTKPSSQQQQQQQQTSTPVTTSQAKASPVKSLADSPTKPGLNFTFSSPIAKFVPADKPESPQKHSGFQFSSPIRMDQMEDYSTVEKSAAPVKSSENLATSGFTFATPVTTKSPMMEYTFKAAPKPKTKPITTDMDVGFGVKAATELKTGSVMDILGGGSKKSTDTSSTTQPLKQPDLSTMFKKSGWTCDVCLINNKDDMETCAACMSPKPGPPKPKESAPSTLSSFGSVVPGNWVCDTCLIQNKKDATTCAACTTPKPSAAVSSSSSSSKPSDPLMSKFKPSAGQWECEVCLVQNKADDSSCIACTTPKPLKFFKPPAGDWTCDTCLVSNKEAAISCIACSSARPGPPRTQTVPSCVKTFTMSQTSGFSIPSTTSSASESVNISTKGGFSISKSDSKPPESGFKFNTSATNDNKRDNDSVGGFKFDAGTSSTTATTSGFKFGDSKSSDKTSTNSDSKTQGGFTFTAETKSTNSTSGFTFGAKSDNNTEESGAKVSNSVFGKSETAATTSASTEVKSSTSTGSIGGFTFGAAISTNSEVKTSTALTNSMAFGGAFKASDSVISAFKLNGGESNIKPGAITSQSIGGFNFSAVITTANSVPVTSNNAVGGFTFSTTKASDTGGTTQGSTPAFGGFNFSSGSSESNKLSKSFSFSSKPAENGAPPTKRGRDEGPTEGTKKLFAFGQKSESPGGSMFGAKPEATSIANVFGSKSSTTPQIGNVFGQKSETSVVASVFGQKSETAALPNVFGQKSESAPSLFGQKSDPSSATTVFGQKSDSSATSVFGQKSEASGMSSVFGQKSASSSSNLVFGQSSTGATTTTSSLFVFGSTPTAASTTSGASTTPVFGQFNSNSSSGAAQSTGVLQFGQKNKAAPAPAFNLGNTNPTQANSTFGNGSSTFSLSGQKTETSSNSTSNLFKFGAQPSEAPASAFNSSSFGSSGSFGSGFGSTQSTTPAFGAMAPTLGSSNSTPAQAPAPAFGGSTFGSTNSQPAPAANNLFQFGGAKPAEGAGAPSTGFNFGATAQAAPSFNFGVQAPATGTFSFSAGTGTASDSGRRIKKAVRKIKR